jgi:DNA-binding transcriptional regulator GbsR (MarR family)
MPATADNEWLETIERHGTFFERRGMTPMEARVFALLLLSDPPHLDFYTIQDRLGASKSAISNALNRLLEADRIDYLTKPGDRKRYFGVNPMGWLERMKTEIDSVAPFVDRMDQILHRRAGMGTPEFNEQLRYVRSFFAFMAEEFPKLMAEWERRNNR